MVSIFTGLKNALASRGALLAGVTIFGALCGAGAAIPAAAFERMSGCFEAARTCPARSSIRKDRNPGAVELKVGRTYRLLGANKKNATHYQIRIPDAEPRDRWVGAACGRLLETCALADADTPTQVESNGLPKTPSTNNVIAISWQPAFCQSHQSKTECASQTPDRFDARHFTLHGLWPQPRSNVYCAVTPEASRASRDKRWAELPALPLSPELRTELDKVMPGTRSNLHRYEWIKHGTCYGAGPEQYYRASLAVMREINASSVQQLFASSIGRSLTSEQIRKSFDRAFGEGAGERVTVSCEGRGNKRLIVELIVGLSGAIADKVDVAALIRAAKPRSVGCRSGFVDAVGF